MLVNLYRPLLVLAAFLMQILMQIKTLHLIQTWIAVVSSFDQLFLHSKFYHHLSPSKLKNAAPVSGICRQFVMPLSESRAFSIIYKMATALCMLI